MTENNANRIIPPASPSPQPKHWLNRTVAGAGITSALGDFCYETTTVILPGFLAVLGIPAAVLGIIEGIADAVASFTKMILAATTLLTASLGVVQAAQVAGLLYVWRNVVQVAVSYPVGAMADRIGHLPVLIAGYVLGTLTAVLTALAFWFGIDSIAPLAGIFFIAGLYVAVQEALESTVTAGMVQTETLAISYGALGTVNGTAKLISSTTVGVLWTAVSPVFGFGLAALLMAGGTLALLRVKQDGCSLRG